MMIYVMIASLLTSPAITKAFRPTVTSVSRANLVTMSAAADLTGKTCVTVQESLNVFGSSSAKYVDGSWFLKGRNARAEYEAGPRIEGAQFFDIDDIASKGPDLNPKNLKHMMPPKQLFAAAMDAMGITNEDHIILYGTKGCVSLTGMNLASKFNWKDKPITELYLTHTCMYVVCS